MMKNELLMIGELAKKMDVTVRALQYYDKEGLLRPSATSEGGRRLYSSKDVVKLYQILSMKSLGFPLAEIKKMLLTLDNPAQVAEVLEQQNELVRKRIAELQEVSTLIQSLRDEVLQIDRVDFEQYANIVGMLKAGNDFYWMVKLLDDTLTEHSKQRFTERPELGLKILENYRNILDEGVELINAGEAPLSERSMLFAKKWWDMVTEFTGGDMSLLPKLLDFDGDKSGWDEGIAEKQKLVDGYIGPALIQYFLQNGIVVPGMEEDI